MFIVFFNGESEKLEVKEVKEIQFNRKSFETEAEAQAEADRVNKDIVVRTCKVCGRKFYMPGEKAKKIESEGKKLWDKCLRCNRESN